MPGSAVPLPPSLVHPAFAMVLRSGPQVRSVEMYESHGPMVYGRARRILGNHEDAQEATQEVFVRVITGSEKVPPAGEIVPWLCRITTNFCLNKIRDAHRRRELLDTRGKSPLGEPVDAGPDTLAQVRALFARADERQAQAAVYVYLDGMSHDEAAEMLGVSRRTVGNLLERFTAWAREQAGEPPAHPAMEGGQ
jgi:RNA polymerase sigma-70 factor, ECF subfamily